MNFVRKVVGIWRVGICSRGQPEETVDSYTSWKTHSCYLAFRRHPQKQVPHLPKIYGRDMFPDCTFTFLKPPVTNAKNKSRSFMEELNDFTSRVEAVKDSFDVALVSCGGYGNPIL